MSECSGGTQTVCVCVRVCVRVRVRVCVAVAENITCYTTEDQKHTL